MAETTVTATHDVLPFTRTDVLLVRTDDPRCALIYSNTQVGVEQDAYGPRLFVVGKQASDQKLARMAEKFPDFSLRQLMDFRDAA